MKIAIVTGANNGIGLETAKQLAELGVKLLSISSKITQCIE